MWLSQSSSTGPSVVSFLNVQTEKKATPNARAIDCHGWLLSRAATASANQATRSPRTAMPTPADRIHPHILLWHIASLRDAATETAPGSASVPGERIYSTSPVTHVTTPKTGRRAVPSWPASATPSPAVTPVALAS